LYREPLKEIRNCPVSRESLEEARNFLGTALPNTILLSSWTPPDPLYSLQTVPHLVLGVLHHLLGRPDKTHLLSIKSSTCLAESYQCCYFHWSLVEVEPVTKNMNHWRRLLPPITWELAGLESCYWPPGQKTTSFFLYSKLSIWFFVHPANPHAMCCTFTVDRL
jgi:hypothetical protein